MNPVDSSQIKDHWLDVAQLPLCLYLISRVKQLLSLEPLLDMLKLLSGAMLNLHFILRPSSSLLEEPEISLKLFHIVDLAEFNVFESLLLEIFQVLVLLLFPLLELVDLLESHLHLQPLL